MHPCFSVFVFYREQPVLWGVEVSSGHGPREVRTALQLSDRPLVDHVLFETGDLYAPHHTQYTSHTATNSNYPCNVQITSLFNFQITQMKQ